MLSFVRRSKTIRSGILPSRALRLTVDYTIIAVCKGSPVTAHRTTVTGHGDWRTNGGVWIDEFSVKLKMHRKVTRVSADVGDPPRRWQWRQRRAVRRRRQMQRLIVQAAEQCRAARATVATHSRSVRSGTKTGTTSHAGIAAAFMLVSSSCQVDDSPTSSSSNNRFVTEWSLRSMRLQAFGRAAGLRHVLFTCGINYSPDGLRTRRL